MENNDLPDPGYHPPVLKKPAREILSKLLFFCQDFLILHPQILAG
jgi:hypothetical protein